MTYCDTFVTEWNVITESHESYHDIRGKDSGGFKLP